MPGYKVTLELSQGELLQVGVCAESLTHLKKQVQEKFNLPQQESLDVFLEDGTLVCDEEYFKVLEPQTKFRVQPPGSLALGKRQPSHRSEMSPVPKRHAVPPPEMLPPVAHPNTIQYYHRLPMNHFHQTQPIQTHSAFFYHTLHNPRPPQYTSPPPGHFLQSPCLTGHNPTFFPPNMTLPPNHPGQMFPPQPNVDSHTAYAMRCVPNHPQAPEGMLRQPPPERVLRQPNHPPQLEGLLRQPNHPPPPPEGVSRQPNHPPPPEGMRRQPNHPPPPEGMRRQPNHPPPPEGVSRQPPPERVLRQPPPLERLLRQRNHPPPPEKVSRQPPPPPLLRIPPDTEQRIISQPSSPVVNSPSTRKQQSEVQANASLTVGHRTSYQSGMKESEIEAFMQYLKDGKIPFMRKDSVDEGYSSPCATATPSPAAPVTLLSEDAVTPVVAVSKTLTTEAPGAMQSEARLTRLTDILANQPEPLSDILEADLIDNSHKEPAPVTLLSEDAVTPVVAVSKTLTTEAPGAMQSEARLTRLTDILANQPEPLSDILEADLIDNSHKEPGVEESCPGVVNIHSDYEDGVKLPVCTKNVDTTVIDDACANDDTYQTATVTTVFADGLPIQIREEPPISDKPQSLPVNIHIRLMDGRIYVKPSPPSSPLPSPPPSPMNLVIVVESESEDTEQETSESVEAEQPPESIVEPPESVVEAERPPKSVVEAGRPPVSVEGKRPPPESVVNAKRPSESGKGERPPETGEGEKPAEIEIFECACEEITHTSHSGCTEDLIYKVLATLYSIAQGNTRYVQTQTEIENLLTTVSENAVSKPPVVECVNVLASSNDQDSEYVDLDVENMLLDTDNDKESCGDQLVLNVGKEISIKIGPDRIEESEVLTKLLVESLKLPQTLTVHSSPSPISTTIDSLLVHADSLCEVDVGLIRQFLKGVPMDPRLKVKTFPISMLNDGHTLFIRLNFASGEWQGYIV